MQRVYSHSPSSTSSSPCHSSSIPQTRLPSVPEDGFDSGVLTVSSPQASTAELIKEIATLETEVIHLEQYLLSLYRSAFDHHFSTLPHKARLQRQTGSWVQDVPTQSCSEDNIDIQRSGRLQQSFTFPVKEKGTHLQSQPGSQPCFKEDTDIKKSSSSSVSGSAGSDYKNADSSDLRSLGDYLGAPLVNRLSKIPSRLSEDIIKCISAIYCRIDDNPQPYTGLSASPTSSLSSSRIFSGQDRESWSSPCNEEQSSRSEGIKETNGPYNEMVQVRKICLDGDRFNYVEIKLQTYRSLIQHLEKVDPMKMKHKEKLAFWINICNALVMHAHLAYGIHRNRMKNTSHALKVSYNIGGQSVNAYTIQTSILGCRQHRTASWVKAFLSPGIKIQTGNEKHAYALDYPEPFVHFALCSGAYSDPPVRVYRAKSVLIELHHAKDEFIQSTVSIYKREKIVMPKILYHFAKDASLNIDALLEMVQACLFESQQQAMQRCRKGRPDKYIEWSSYNTSFRYIINKELANGRASIQK